MTIKTTTKTMPEPGLNRDSVSKVCFQPSFGLVPICLVVGGVADAVGVGGVVAVVAVASYAPKNRYQ